jgi:predicted transcriptional regulator
MVYGLHMPRGNPKQAVTFKADPKLVKRLDRAAKRAKLTRSLWLERVLAVAVDSVTVKGDSKRD